MQQVFTFDSTSAKVHYWKARVHAIQNDRGKALGELAKAVAVEYSFPQVLDPDFMSVWRDPDFTAILAGNRTPREPHGKADELLKDLIPARREERRGAHQGFNQYVILIE